MNVSLLDIITHRRQNAHKYDFGHVLVVGGSPGMAGAPLLCAEAALRMGAGLVTIAAEQSVERSLERRVHEVMTVALPPNESDAVRAVTSFIHERKVSAVVVGPGLTSKAAGMVQKLVPLITVPLLLDAGGLAAFNGNPTELYEASSKNNNIIITPHSGEYARLTGIADGHLQHAHTLAATYGITIVLKGSHTKVCYGQALYKNTTGNPGLATAGTGDVLTGVIAGLCAQGINSAEAAQLGVFMHGLAGDLAAADKTQAGMIASDVVEYIPAALRSVTS